MKNFKFMLIGVFAAYLFSVSACKKNQVEVIPGGLNSANTQDYPNMILGTAKPLYLNNEDVADK